MAQFFTNYDFDKGVAQGLERAQRKAQREEQVRQFDEGQVFREKELAERIVARKAVDELREKQLAETIRSNEKREYYTGRGQDFDMAEAPKIRDWKSAEAEKDRGWKSDVAEKERGWKSDEAKKGRNWKSDEDDELRHWTEGQTERKYQRENQLLKYGKTKEERAKKSQDRSMMSTIPTFEEYDQNEVVDGVKDEFLFNEDLGFDEGEFREAADQYINSMQKNMTTVISALNRDPNDPTVVKHLDDLKMIYDMFDSSGEYTGPLDSTVFDWVDGEASGARRSKAKIARLLNAAGRPVE